MEQSGCEEINLETKEHSAELLHQFQKLQKSQCFCDVTIKVLNADISTYKVHGLLLLAACDLFKESYKNGYLHHNAVICVEGVEAVIFETVMNFMYTGKLSLLSDQFCQLYWLSVALNMKALILLLKDFNGQKSRNLTQSGDQEDQQIKIYIDGALVKSQEMCEQVVRNDVRNENDTEPTLVQNEQDNAMDLVLKNRGVAEERFRIQKHDDAGNFEKSSEHEKTALTDGNHGYDGNSNSQVVPLLRFRNNTQQADHPSDDSEDENSIPSDKEIKTEKNDDYDEVTVTVNPALRNDDHEDDHDENRQLCDNMKTAPKAVRKSNTGMDLDMEVDEVKTEETVSTNEQDETADRQKEEGLDIENMTFRNQSASSSADSNRDSYTVPGHQGHALAPFHVINQGQGHVFRAYNLFNQNHSNVETGIHMQDAAAKHINHAAEIIGCYSNRLSSGICGDLRSNIEKQMFPHLRMSNMQALPINFLTRATSSDRQTGYTSDGSEIDFDATCNAATQHTCTGSAEGENVQKKHCYECTVCHEYFACKSYLRRHEKEVHSMGNYKKKQKSNQDDIINYEKLYCRQHDKSFPDRAALTKHVRNIHHRRLAYECNHCWSAYGSEKLILMHYAKKHGMGLNTDKYPLLRCSFEGCSFATIVSYDLSQHEKSHRSENVVCDVCGKTLKTQTTLRNHKQTVHGHEEDLGKGKKRKLDKRRQCEQCGKTFTNGSAYRNHIQYVHTDEKPFLCAKCSFSTKTQGDLNRHMRCTHGENPKGLAEYKCEICQLRLINKSTYQTHMDRHKGERNYPCEVCGKAYISASELRQHSKWHNKKEDAKFVCTHEGCTYMTHNRQGLKNHVQGVHSSAKDFKCHVCEYKTGLRGNLVKHLRSVHKLEVQTKRFINPNLTIKDRVSLDEIRGYVKIDNRGSIIPLSLEDYMYAYHAYKEDIDREDESHLSPEECVYEDLDKGDNETPMQMQQEMK